MKPRHIQPKLGDVLTTTRELMGDSRTYLRLFYLLAAFPLATTYFVVIVTGLSVGLGLAIIMVGFLILVLTLLCWMLFARLERELAIHLLGVTVRPISVPDPGPRTLLQRLRKLLTDPVTWKSLAYLLVEFPFSIFSFTLTVSLLTTSVSLALAPVAWLVAAAFDPAFPADAFQHSDFPGPGFAHAPAGNQLMALLAICAVGVLLTIASVALLNGIGWLWGRFASVMLGASESHIQLAAAKSEAQAQQARADRADQSRRELIVNASHELRTPVASISAHVESLLKPERQIDDDTRRYLTVVAAETDRLGSLVDDVLALARADADELHLDIRPTDVDSVIAHVCEALAPLARRERNLSLVHSSAAGLPRAMADRDRLAQVLTNLIRNAVNHTPDGGIISVEAGASGDQVNITVSDTGIGMEPTELARIFDRFYRTDQSRARGTGGSGLGLSIVRDLLNAMGATIDADSTLGSGSVFTVSLRREAA